MQPGYPHLKPGGKTMALCGIPGGGGKIGIGLGVPSANDPASMGVVCAVLYPSVLELVWVLRLSPEDEAEGKDGG